MPEKILKIEGDKKPELPRKEEVEEVYRLEKPIQVLLEKIIGSIERGDYELIIGADASGRVPAIIFSKFINRVYQKKGYQSPKTIFLAGAGMSLKNKQEPDFVTYKKGMASKYIEQFNHKRVLIVEDTIVKGSSIHFLGEILKEKGIPFDVVSVSSYNTAEELEEARSYLGADGLYVGTERSSGIYGSRHLSGVIKEREQVFSRPYKEQFDTEKEKLNIQENINQTRKDANIVADNLVDWYESQKQENE